MFIPDQYQESNADQESRQGLSKCNQAAERIGIAEVKNQEGNGDAKHRIRKIVQSGRVVSPVIDSGVVVPVLVDFFSHGNYQFSVKNVLAIIYYANIVLKRLYMVYQVFYDPRLRLWSRIRSPQTRFIFDYII